MNRQRYEKTMMWLKAHERFTRFAVYTEKVSELLVYAIYPLFLLFLVIKGDGYFIRSVLTCGISFVLVSILRSRLNAKRPYEVYGIAAAMKKDKKGCSMPSRHVFSASIISVSIFFVCPLLSLVCAVLSVIIALLRVVLGVHFIRDVAAGALIGVGLGLFGSFIF